MKARKPGASRIPQSWMIRGRLRAGLSAWAVAGCLVACSSEPPSEEGGLEGDSGSSGRGGDGGSAGRVMIGVTGGSAGTAGAGAGGIAGSSAGDAGSTSVAGSGGQAGGGGSGGTGPGNLPPVICAEPPARCPANVFDGDAYISNSDGDPATYVGVTEITGSLRLFGAVPLDVFDCLEVVGDDIDLDRSSDGDTLSGAFPNLRTVAGGVDIRISSSYDPVPADCAFRVLESIGSGYATGGAVDVNGPLTGELNLTTLHDFDYIRIKYSDLSRVILPSDGEFPVDQLAFQGNELLTEVLGFDNTTLTGSSSISYSLLISDNPWLSGCRVKEIAALFDPARYAADSIIIENNGPGCE